LWHGIVECFDVGKFLSRLEHAGLERLCIVPALHNADDVDRHQLEIGRQLLTVAGHPGCLVREPNKGALDDPIVRTLFATFDCVFVTLEAVDRVRRLYNVIRHFDFSYYVSVCCFAGMSPACFP
jgi:hypothetical protein